MHSALKANRACAGNSDWFFFHAMVERTVRLQGQASRDSVICLDGRGWAGLIFWNLAFAKGSLALSTLM